MTKKLLVFMICGAIGITGILKYPEDPFIVGALGSMMICSYLLLQGSFSKDSNLLSYFMN